MQKILIIEDEAAIRRVLVKILSEESDTYSVEEAEDGLSGIEKIKKEDGFTRIHPLFCDQRHAMVQAVSNMNALFRYFVGTI